MAFNSPTLKDYILKTRKIKAPLGTTEAARSLYYVLF